MSGMSAAEWITSADPPSDANMRRPHGFSRRLQIQEKLTAEIAEAIQDVLQSQGVGVVIEAEQSCMTLRGVNTTASTLTTSRLLGVIRDDPRTRDEFLGLVRGS
jgi:GTP cyclohydrolase I